MLLLDFIGGGSGRFEMWAGLPSQRSVHTVRTAPVVQTGSFFCRFLDLPSSLYVALCHLLTRLSSLALLPWVWWWFD